MSDELVMFDDVEVIRASSQGIICRITQKEVWIGSLQVQTGSTVRERGERGRLVLRRDDALLLGLLDR